MGRYDRTPEERFREKVDKDGPVPAHRPELGPCWVWTGSKNRKGYGHLRVAGVLVRANRFAWSLDHGEIPDEMQVLHECDNPACVRGSHLYLGTHKRNMMDMVERDRSPRGERAPSAKLSEAQVLELRRRRAAGEELEELGAAFGIAANNVCSVATGATWGHLGGIVAPGRPSRRAT